MMSGEVPEELHTHLLVGPAGRHIPPLQEPEQVVPVVCRNCLGQELPQQQGHGHENGHGNVHHRHGLGQTLELAGFPLLSDRLDNPLSQFCPELPRGHLHHWARVCLQPQPHDPAVGHIHYRKGRHLKLH